MVRGQLRELLEAASSQEEAEREVSPRQAGGRAGLSQAQPVWARHSCPGLCARVSRPRRVGTVAPPQDLACCFGICAISHLDDTLAQLEDFVKSNVLRKSIGIFNIFKVQRSG